MKCPICGYNITRGGEWSRTDYHTFEQTTDFMPTGGTRAPAPVAAVPAGVTLKRQRPARAATLRSDVAVPCIQSVITGLLAIMGGGGIAAAAGWDVLIVSAIVGAIVTGAAWYLLLRQHSDLLWEIETITGVDLDGDGEKGRPKESTPVEVHIPPGKDQEGKQTLFMDLPAPPDVLRIFARAVLSGQPMTEGAWSGKGRLFSKPEFILLRDELIDRKLAAWRNPKHHAQGCYLRKSGKYVFRQLAQLKQQEIKEE